MKIMMVVVALVLASCQPTTSGYGDGEGTLIRHRKLQNGLECVIMGSNYRGGISCNWDKWNKETR